MRHPAEFNVVYWLGDSGVLTTYRTIGIFAQLQLSELRVESIDYQHASDERLAYAYYKLYGLHGLYGADDATHHAQHPRSAQLGTEPGGGGVGKRSL